MRFHVQRGKELTVATVILQLPAYIGCTSDRVHGGERSVVANMANYTFSIAPGEWGTMVYDYQDWSLRTPGSARFCHYHWEKGKLTLSKGLDPRRLHQRFELHREIGLVYKHQFCVYHTFGKTDPGVHSKKVELFHLLQFLESKRTLQELDNVAIT